MNPIRSGNGSAARWHFICYFVYMENKQYHHMFASWREKFVVCRWLFYLFLFKNCNSNRTSDSAVYQWHLKVGRWERISILKIQNGVHACYSAPLRECQPRSKIVWCIPVDSEFKYLGLIFDKKPTFNKYVKYLKDRCMKACLTYYE